MIHCSAECLRMYRKVGGTNLFGDLNDCYGKGLQQDIAESNKLEQELIEDGNRYIEMIEEENYCITK